MKLLIQRVLEASVSIENEMKGQIQNGFLLYICFETQDTIEQVHQAVTKITNLRVFEDHEQKMNKNIFQSAGSILSISQFTLSWDGKKGHRPSFANSLAPSQAKILYRHFNDELSKLNLNVQKGLFGSDMKVASINDGPVTFFLEFK